MFPSSFNILPQSIFAADEASFALARTEAGDRLAILTPSDSSLLADFAGDTSEYRGETLFVGSTDPRNAAALRQHLDWLRPRTLGLRTSAGMGDRLGLATPGHVRALRALEQTERGCDNGAAETQNPKPKTQNPQSIAPIFAQQSIREMTRTGRTPQQVMDDATWGIFAEGWRDGAGADADHLKTPADIDACAAAGFTFFTIDPGEYVDNTADVASLSIVYEAVRRLPWDALEDSLEGLLGRYLERTIHVEGRSITSITFEASTLLRAAAKYGRAVAHVTAMYRHLVGKWGDGEQRSSGAEEQRGRGGQSAIRNPQSAIGNRFELEVSVDETETPTGHADHIYIAQELRRLGVQWVSLAPRYVGRFEKGVDYIGDLETFERTFAVHAAIARQFGPYKLSLHSGSDKFSIYPIAAHHTQGLVHLKTAGTSYLEALRTIAALDPALFREIYAFARDRYPTDRASYHVSARLEKAPLPQDLSNADLPGLLDQFDAREILHVTFGSVLTTRTADGRWLFYDRFMALLRAHPEEYAANLQAHFLRHLRPFVH